MKVSKFWLLIFFAVFLAGCYSVRIISPGDDSHVSGPLFIRLEFDDDFDRLTLLEVDGNSVQLPNSCTPIPSGTCEFF